MRLDEELRIAKELAFLAGKRILDVYSKDFDVIMKSDETPLTEADLSANKVIIDKIMKIFPDHSILSEEISDDKARLDNDWCWIIDPVDGTKEFVKKNDEFTVNIALTFRGEVVLGVVYAPVFDELYYAINGQGAFLEKNNEKISIHVSDRTSNLRVLKSRSHMNVKYASVLEMNKDRIMSVTKMGSSLKGCKIASGEYDIYYNFGAKTSVWDTAAMQIIVEEAGGVFTDLDGNMIDYSSADVKNKNGFRILNRIENHLE